MVKAITPFSTRAKEGATDAPLGDFVTVDQTITSTANAGFFDKNTGKFEGVLGSDKLFTIDATHEAVPNGQAVLCPQATPDYIDMTGFSDILIAIRPSSGGNVAIEAVFGPATNTFSNLSPIRSGSGVRIATDGEPSDEGVYSGFYDATEALTADVWNIYNIQGRLSDQKVLQFNITNNSGSESNITFAYMRLV